MFKLKFARFCGWFSLFFMGLGLYIVLIGKFHLHLPLLTISGTRPLDHFIIALVLNLVARFLGPIPWGELPIAQIYERWARLAAAPRWSVLAGVVLLLLVLVGGQFYQNYFIGIGDKFMANGQAANSAENYRLAAKWPLGRQEYAKAYRSCMLFSSGEFNQCVDENISEFHEGVKMRSTRYRCLWSCLGELKRYEEALEVVETSLKAEPKMMKYAPAADYFRRMIQTNQGATGRRIPVRFAIDNPEGRELRVRGSWTERGTQSQIDGWKSAHPMTNEGGKAAVTIPLGLSGRLPYGAVIEAKDAGAETYTEVAMAHFWNSGEDESVEAVVRPISEKEPEARAPWKRAPADGRPRTLVIWPDGGSWFFLNTLIERGGLPNIARFLETTANGKMISTHPPMTATAYLKMVRIEDENQKAQDDKGFWQMLALQLKGIPFLDWAFDDEVGSLEGDPNTIFNILREHGHSAVNLVFSDRYMSAPGDDSSKKAEGAGQNVESADLEAADIIRELGIDASKEPERAEHIEESLAFIKAYNNTAAKRLIGEQVWKSGDHDFALLRFPAVDLMSHKYAADAFDDAKGNLMLETYRQFDMAFGAFMDLMDEDDTLILVSDHGVEGALSHHPDCVLAVSGPQVDVGARLPVVSIAQLPHLILSRFDVDTHGFDEKLRATLLEEQDGQEDAN